MSRRRYNRVAHLPNLDIPGLVTKNHYFKAVCEPEKNTEKISLETKTTFGKREST